MYEGPTVAFKPQGPEGHDLALLVRTTPLYHDIMITHCIALFHAFV